MLNDEIATQTRARRERDADYAAARERLLELERGLDYLVPRLLARETLVEARRDQVSRALAGLADVSREVDIAPEVRARLLAVSPMLLDRLRGAEASAAQLRDTVEQQSAEYRQLLAQAPEVLEARQRAELLREQAARRKTAVEERLAELHAEIASLVAEQTQIAEKLIAREAAEVARVEPQADEPTANGARPDMEVDHLPEAIVKGEVAADELLVAEPPGTVEVPGASKRALVVGRPAPALSANADVRSLIGPPPAKPRGTETPAGGSVTAGLAAAAETLNEGSPIIRSSLSALVAPARLEDPGAPVLPAPGEVVAGGQPRLVHGEYDPSLVIEAQAGQAVAAPDSGRVVFAGRFKRYGLLLMIEHSPDYHTLLWGFAELRVERGDRVRAGQLVGVLGSSGGAPPSLHMEVRQNGQPVNPLLWMAASNSKVQG
jgi:murein DD-endopeptidase MepM/ murein hydrolase activator NlpD